MEAMAHLGLTLLLGTAASLAVFKLSVLLYERVKSPLLNPLLVTVALIIAALVQLLETVMHKYMPPLYNALGIYLPLITTNCAVLGVALLNTQNDYNFIESVVYGITGGLGFLLAIFLFAAVREQLEVSGDNPKAFDGFPIALVTAGLMALAFMGFSGLKVW